MPTRFFIPIVLGSSRRGRQSPKAARFIESHLQRLPEVYTQIVDLAEYDLPMLEERIRMRNDAPPRALEFASTLSRAHAIVFVSPEYNGGYPAVLKNALDWASRPPQTTPLRKEPIGIMGASSGESGAIRSQLALRPMFDPLPVDQPAKRAVRMAFELQQAFVPIARAWQQKGHAVSLGIGIAQGEATLGVIGFEQRWEYAAIGAIPNLAARLCGQARPGEILIDAVTYADVSDAAEAAPAGSALAARLHPTHPRLPPAAAEIGVEIGVRPQFRGNWGLTPI